VPGYQITADGDYQGPNVPLGQRMAGDRTGPPGARRCFGRFMDPEGSLEVDSNPSAVYCFVPAVTFFCFCAAAEHEKWPHSPA
jgi:hypothetical protein